MSSIAPNDHEQFLSAEGILNLMKQTLPFHVVRQEQQDKSKLLCSLFVYLHRFDEVTDGSSFLPASYFLCSDTITIVFHRPQYTLSSTLTIKEHTVFNDYGLDAIGQLRWYHFNCPRHSELGLLSDQGKFPKRLNIKDVYMQVFEGDLSDHSADHVFDFLYYWKQLQIEQGIQVG